ncbi:hypothetical protein M011DRAFT_408900 [Sporormia fimetaria CBS 119925]|uniref:DNA polymerase delta subunit 4 n=1 Tax=Sporormia fimetaria CBS 119925 TaxID=1340428 RepID=A0A6A6V385_9PLEO|nr:hypothetical protein M011DRAFT_408900 [Sporormia fimetaria CBS 119925]
MPPKRQSSGTARSTRQSTLAFHGSSNKVTKSGTRAQRGKKAVADVPNAKVIEPEVDDVKATEPESAAPEAVAIDEPVSTPDPAVKVKKPSSAPEEEQARKISQAQIKKYWTMKEKERKAPRVHQKDIGLHDKILREFDLSSHYGPCVGVTRLRRWQRAHRLGLQPPIEVLAVLLKEQESGDAKAQRSRVDELLNMHTLEVEGTA